MANLTKVFYGGHFRISFGRTIVEKKYNSDDRQWIRVTTSVYDVGSGASCSFSLLVESEELLDSNKTVLTSVEERDIKNDLSNRVCLTENTNEVAVLDIFIDDSHIIEYHIDVDMILLDDEFYLVI